MWRPKLFVFLMYSSMFNCLSSRKLLEKYLSKSILLSLDLIKDDLPEATSLGSFKNFRIRKNLELYVTGSLKTSILYRGVSLLNPYCHYRLWNLNTCGPHMPTAGLIMVLGIIETWRFSRNYRFFLVNSMFQRSKNMVCCWGNPPKYEHNPTMCQPCIIHSAIFMQFTNS